MPKQTGPKTAEGKAKSSRNALKHGLASAKMFVLDNEDPFAWEALCDAWIARLQPRDECERDLVFDIAHALWRIRRAKSIETALLDISMSDREDVFEPKYTVYDEGMRLGDAWQALTDHSKALDNVHRYEIRARRAFDKTLAAFERIRAKFPMPGPVAPKTENCQNEMPEPSAPEPVEPPAEPTQPVQAEPVPAKTENVRIEMPPALKAEFAAHRKRDPLFNPTLDASQMSKALRNWFERKVA